METGKKATEVGEAAYNHLMVFTQSVTAWPDELRQRLPSFRELYVDPPKVGRLPGIPSQLEARLRSAPGPVKLLLTGQKGSGKSWALEHLAQVLQNAFTVVRVSATDRSGVAVADLEVGEILVLLCAALAEKLGNWTPEDDIDHTVRRWATALQDLAEIPVLPLPVDGGLDLSLLFAKLSVRLRSDLATRELIRKVGANELVIVANAMIEALDGKPTLLIFDDLDKLLPERARRVFGDQFAVIGRVRTKMVLTYPYSLNFEHVLAQPADVIPNIQVKDSRSSTTIRPEALERFTALLDRLVDLTLVDGHAVERAVGRSGGIAREFGKIMARAFEVTALSGDSHVTTEHVDDAIRELRIVLERATQDRDRRESLERVHRLGKLETAMDRALLDENLIIEYINGKPWYDVHPLLTEVVDSWPKPKA